MVALDSADHSVVDEMLSTGYTLLHNDNGSANDGSNNGIDDNNNHNYDDHGAADDPVRGDDATDFPFPVGAAATAVMTPTSALLFNAEAAASALHSSSSSSVVDNGGTSTTTMRRRDSSAEELILGVVDQVEDGWDEHAYEDIVPWEIKLAIEEQVFGWSHLLSNILGHVVFTLSAFGIVYLAWYQFAPTYVWLRYITSALAGWSSFRMVRRRRKVWLRAPYGSQRYRQDAERRLREVAQADQTTWLGRIRKLRNEKRVLKQLQRAETNFLAHHEKRRRRHETAPLTPNRHRRRPSFRTDPVPVMQSIQHDQILFANGPIQRLLYIHGSYFGAAPFMLNNPHWISLLRHLMPDVYVEISRRVNKAPPYRLIHWAENNPVVAAYGTAQSLENSGTTPNVEWDVFLDPDMVHNVHVVLQARETFLASVYPEYRIGARPMATIAIPGEAVSPSQRSILRYYNAQLHKRVRLLVDKMLIAHGNLTQLSLEQTGYAKHYIYSRVRRTRRTLGGGIYARQWMAVYAESLRIGVLDESVSPPPPSSTSSDAATSSTSSTTSSPNKLGGYRRGSTLNSIAESSCPDFSIARSVEIIRAISKCADPFGLVLDVKSRHVPKPVWACVVDTLRADGVRVEGIGAFVMDDIRGLSHFTIKPVREIMLFHSAGDLQRACHDGLVQRGDSVLFNGGSLIWSPPKSLPGLLWLSYDAHQVKRSYRLYPFAHTQPSPAANRRDSSSGHNDTAASGVQDMVTSSSTIEHYKQYYELSIGLYVQEFAIDEAAVNLLVDYCNKNQHVYDLGLNWGGVNGITIRGIQPDRFTSTDGYWNQRHIGRDWDPGLAPPSISSSSSYQASARLT